jgi:glycyl-tRNA synthetase beta chain
VREYILDRLRTFEWAQPAPSPELIDAVLACHPDDVVDAMHRIQSLQRLGAAAGLRKAAKVIERTRNILKGAPRAPRQVDPEKLQEPQEQKLWEVYQAHQQGVVELADRRSYAEATTKFGEAFYDPLHDFFDKVMVNVPEPSLQQNRLALMQAIHTLYTDRIADLSKLTSLQHEETPLR